MSPVRIGVIGCAQILARSLIDPLAGSEGYIIQGIASRTFSKAEQYAKEYGIPVAFDSYEALLRSEEIDMVYIVLSNDLHKEWTIKALQAHKHVLVEKPLCLSSAEYLEIEQAAGQSDVQLLEGLMVQHHPWLDKVKSIVDEQPYGRLLRVETAICIVPKYDLTQNYRSMPDKGGGSFLDLGCYWLQFLQRIAGLEPVEYAGSSAFDGPNGCDMTFEASLQYSDGMVASVVTSFEQPYKSAHTLYFEQATVTVNDFFRASLGSYKIALKIDTLHNADSCKLYFEPQNYYRNQLSFFHNVITGKQQNLPLTDSMERIAWSEAIYQYAKERRQH